MLHIKYINLCRWAIKTLLVTINQLKKTGSNFTPDQALVWFSCTKTGPGPEASSATYKWPCQSSRTCLCRWNGVFNFTYTSWEPSGRLTSGCSFIRWARIQSVNDGQDHGNALQLHIHKKSIQSGKNNPPCSHPACRFSAGGAAGRLGEGRVSTLMRQEQGRGRCASRCRVGEGPSDCWRSVWGFTIT